VKKRLTFSRDVTIRKKKKSGRGGGRGGQRKKRGGDFTIDRGFKIVKRAACSHRIKKAPQAGAVKK